MHPRPRRWPWTVALLTLAGPLAAKVEAESEYTKAQTYSGALRYLRVDLGYEVTERDADAAYLLFRYQPPGRKQPAQGSIEIVENEGKVRLFVQLPQMPSYHEQVLRDGLLKKLVDEYGKPSRREPERGKRKDEDRPSEGDGKQDKGDSRRR